MAEKIAAARAEPRTTPRVSSFSFVSVASSALTSSYDSKVNRYDIGYASTPAFASLELACTLHKLHRAYASQLFMRRARCRKAVGHQES
jgi:hypothetical protein